MGLCISTAVRRANGEAQWAMEAWKWFPEGYEGETLKTFWNYVPRKAQQRSCSGPGRAGECRQPATNGRTCPHATPRAELVCYLGLVVRFTAIVFVYLKDV